MITKKHDWLKRTFKLNETHLQVEKTLKEYGLSTVCSTAKCPNKAECYNKGTATFQILGNVCTRNCTFCAIQHGEPEIPDCSEPEKIAAFSVRLGLKHTVITSVTRDDLHDGGASQFVDTIKAIRSLSRTTTIEVLTPDFNGMKEPVQSVAESGPDVFSHNVETVERLYPDVRPGAKLFRSLEFLKRIKLYGNKVISKSGFMIGLGETDDEIYELLEKLRSVECDVVTIGQYLAPGTGHHPVVEYCPPETFAMWKERAETLGFLKVFSSVFQRSSFLAEELFNNEMQLP